MAIPNWLTLSIESGNSGTSIVSITAATNPTENERVYALTVRNDNTGLSRIVNIVQGPKINFKDDYLTIEVIEGNGYLLANSGNTIWVSEDTDLENWTLLKSGGTLSSLYLIEEGKAYCLKGDVAANTPIFYINDSSHCTISVYGNIKSVYGGMESGSPINLTNAFNNNVELVDAENLIIEPLSGQVFTSMFANCGNLEVAPQLPIANDIPASGYAHMFYGCLNLTTPPSIIYGKNLGDGCCQGMFALCYALETPPQFQATSLGNNCCNNMFLYCTGLTTAPTISATTIGENCFQEMFRYCGNLQNASAITIPVTNNLCCYNMFEGCTSLTSAPALPATTLAEGCYHHMFVGCTSLTQAPELPAVSATSTCYSHMFSGCSSLNYIKCLAEYLTPNQGGYITSSVESWVRYVAPVGLFLKSPNMNDWTVGNSGIPYGWIVGDADITQYIYLDKSSFSVDSKQYTKTVNVFSSSEWSYSTSANWIELSGNNNTLNIKISDNWGSARNAVITISNIEGISQTITISQAAFDYATEYLTIQMTSSGNVKTINSGASKSIYWSVNRSDTWNNGKTINIDVESGTTISIRNTSDDIQKVFDITGTFNVFGQLSGATKSCPALFKNCTGLTSAEHLIFSMSANNYSNMFEGCTGLTTAPELPASAVTSNGYAYMFAGCTSLTTAPELPAIIDLYRQGCYQFMFSGCTSLTTAPELPSTVIPYDSGSVYKGMFAGCTSLTTAPELPATTLEESCYESMFYGCTSLTSAPELPATTLASSCYNSMFRGCTSLTSAPALPATTLASYCYNNMFYGCTSLTSAPSTLPATTLVSRCYKGMFAECTSLTTAPELPATTLYYNCYEDMFSGCSSLNYIKCLATTITGITATDCTKNWVSGVAPTGTFVKNPNMTGWTISTSGIPNNWTVIDG